MALELPEVPEESQQEAINGLLRSRPQAVLGGPIGGSPPTVSNPHQVFTLDANSIVAGAGLEAAKAVGWRYLVGQPGAAVAGGAPSAPIEAAEVEDVNGAYRFSHRQEGWLPRRTRETMDIAAELPEVSSGAYEPRMLRIPSVSRIDAVWLKNKGAGDDLVVPIASASADIVPGRPYTAENFLGIVRGLAEAPTFDNSPRSRDAGVE